MSGIVEAFHTLRSRVKPAEFDPSKREALKIIGKASACVALADGTLFLGATLKQAAKSLNSDPITASQDTLARAKTLVETMPPGTDLFQRATNTLNNEYKARRDLQERTKLTNIFLFPFGLILSMIGVAVLREDFSKLGSDVGTAIRTKFNKKVR